MKLRSMLKLVLFICLFGFSTVMGQGKAPIITISDGKLKGVANRTIRGKVTYYAYRGIPFAKAPVGNLRFAPPVKNAPWKGTLDVSMDKEPCVQFVNGRVIGSENCLYINVYTTNIRATLPVMVYIYGGKFVFGDSNYGTYGPDHILEKGIVYVSFNYRMGVLGFLSTEDMEAPGNWGLKDQVFALKWVKNNIKSFGGDPNKVTIFGESSGAASVSHLVNSRLTKGLFRGAIMESGVSISSLALCREAKRKAFDVANILGYKTKSTKQLVKYLRTVNPMKLTLARDLVPNIDYVASDIIGRSTFGVVQEPNHPGAVLSSKTWELVKNGDFQRVPIMVGFNSDEDAAVAADAFGKYKPLMLKYDVNRSLLAPYDLTRNQTKRSLAGNEMFKYFFHNNLFSINVKDVDWFINTNYFLAPIREYVTLASKYTDIYLYKFSYKGNLGDPDKKYAGVIHSEELNYLFILGGQGLYPNTKDYEIVQKCVTMWTNFAKTGNPTPKSSSSSILGNLKWIPNKSVNNKGNSVIHYLQINDTLYMDTNPFQKDWNFYSGLYRKYGDPPYSTY